MDNETQVETDHNQTVSLDTGLSNILNTELTNLGPGPPSPASVASNLGRSLNLQSKECLENRQLPTKKRFRVECGRLGRNIRQRLLCGFFSKEGTNFTSVETSLFHTIFAEYLLNVEAPNYPKGRWEADPNQLPQQP